MRRQHSDETKAKISASKAGRPWSAARRAAYKPRTDWTHSAETRAKLSATLRASESLRAHNDRRKITKLGVKASAEHREAIRNSAAHQAARAANVLKAHDARRGQPISDDHRARLSKAHAGRVITWGAKISAALKGRQKSDSHRANNGAAMRASQKAIAQRARIYLANPSSIELMVRNALDAMGVHYVPQFPIGRYAADIYVPQRRLVIECDGTYWHEQRRERDQRRDAYMERHGYSVLRLAERDIRAGVYEAALTNALQSATTS